MKKPLFLLLILHFSSLSVAAATDEGGDRWYEVEILVFSREVDEVVDDELWPEVELPDTLGQAIVLAPPLDAGGVSPQAELVTPYQMLREDDLKLGAFDGRLGRTNEFTPLFHTAWRQPAFPRGASMPVRIRWEQVAEVVAPPSEGEALIAPPQMSEVEGEAGLPAPPGANLTGTLTVSVNRYLHVDADLYYRPAEPVGEDQGPFNIFDVFAREEAPRVYRMHQSRRMRSGEIHYLDHPRFGLIVQVTPYEYPQKADEEESAEPLQDAGRGASAVSEAE